MAQKRRYSQRQKVAAVTAAAASSVLAAAQESGIPARTIGYWMEQPEFAEIRQRTREDLAEEFRVLAHKATARLIDLLPSMEARDVAVVASMSTDKSQLLSGGATIRSEHRDITATLDDHERELLRDAIDRIVHPEGVEA